jgi:hypothetical protein
MTSIVLVSAVTFDTVCLILFVSCVLSFRLSLRLFYVFLVSNFYFPSEYHQFPLSHAAAAAAAAIALKFHPKHEKRKQKTLTKRTNSH